MGAREFEDANAACSLLPGPSLDPACDLLRLPRGGSARRNRRRTRVHRPRCGADPRPLGPVPLPCPTAVGAGRRGGRRCRGAPPSPSHAARGLFGPSIERVREERDAPGSLVGISGRGHRRRRAPWAPTSCSSCLACGLIELACADRSSATRRSTGARRGALPTPRPCRRHRRAGLDGVQGRGAVLRRGVRDHPAHAGRRRPRLPLDDQRPVPQRSRPRTGHPWSGGEHRGGRRICRPRHRWRAPRRGRRVHPVVLVDPARRTSASSASAATPARARFSTAPDRPRSGRSWARRSRWPAPFSEPGSSRFSPPPRRSARAPPRRGRDAVCAGAIGVSSGSRERRCPDPPGPSEGALVESRSWLLRSREKSDIT